MTHSFMKTSYPFGVIEEETKSVIGNGGRDDVRQKSMSLHSHASSASFVSAPDSPDAQKRHALEQKLRLKKQKQAEKKFTDLKNMKNKDLVGKEFGKLADLRASDSVTIAKATRNYKHANNNQTA